MLVTGGNRGLGRGLVEILVRQGARVIFTARDPERGRTALAQMRAIFPAAELELRVCDLADPRSIRDCARSIVASRVALDAVVHNAGVLRPPDVRRLTVDGCEETLATNVLGPFLLTRELMPALDAAASATIVSVGSRLHEPGSRGEEVDFDFDDPFLERGYSPDRAYKNSKLALLWFSYELQRRLTAGITANAVCPGFVPSTAAAYTTGVQRLLLRYVLPRLSFTRSVAEAAADVAWVVTAEGGEGGRYFVDRRPAVSSPQSRDAAEALRFWDLAERWLTEIEGSDDEG